MLPLSADERTIAPTSYEGARRDARMCAHFTRIGNIAFWFLLYITHENCLCHEPWEDSCLHNYGWAGSEMLADWINCYRLICFLSHLASFMISFVDGALVEEQTSPTLLSVLRCVIVFAMQKRCPSTAVIRPSCFVETTLSRRQFRLPVKNNAHVCNRGSECCRPESA